MQRIIVIIPAFNAAATLPALIETIKTDYPHLGVLVIDDGSTDGTGELVRCHGATLLMHERNRGKGAALRSGFDYALSENYDAVITIDADLQHDPGEMQLFLDAYTSEESILVGTRRLDSGMPWERKLSNTLSSFVTSVVSGERIADSQCGFRLIPTPVLRRLHLSGDHYELEPELLIRAARAGYHITSVPIRTIYNGSASAIHPLRDTLRFLQMLLRSLFW